MPTAATSFDNLIHECEAFAAEAWGILGCAPGGFVYVVAATGEEIALPSNSVIEMDRQYAAPDDSGVFFLRTLVDFDIRIDALRHANGRAVRPANNDVIRRDRDGAEETYVVVSPADRQCWEKVGSCYLRVHCEEE